MKTRILLSSLGVFAASVLYAQDTDDTRSKVSWRIMTESETAYGFHKQDLQKSELIIDPEITWKIGKHVKFFTQLRYYNELTDNLEPGKNDFRNYADWSKPAWLDDHSQLELRELYLDAKLGKTYWRLGKQQIVWGQTEGIKILDVINPMNWREFILDDFDDSRIPLWSVKTDFAIGAFKFQGVWIPDLTYHQVPGAGGVFEQQFAMPQIPDGVALSVNNTDKPTNALEDSDVGAKVSTMVKGWDLSLSYLYHYDDVPVVARNLSATTGGPLLTITPTYKRSSMVGFTFGNTVGNFGIRGEAGLTPGKPFTTLSMSDEDGIYMSTQMVSGVGLDFFGVSGTLITMQWFGDLVMAKDAEDYLSRDRMLNYITLMITRSFLNQKLDTRVFSGIGLNNGDGLVDMKASYLLADNLKITLAGDAFFGKRSSVIGQFRDNDRISIGLEFGLQSRD